MTTKTRSLTALSALTVLLLGTAVACSSDSDDAKTTTTMGMTADNADETFAFGEPADPADADRTVDIEMLDALAFDPSTVEVATGETITFHLTNNGTVEHDFVIGDEATQTDHEAEMREMDAATREGGDAAMHSDPNAITVAAGETGDLAWTFSEPGEVLYGCHVVLHYDAGMVGTITVS